MPVGFTLSGEIDRLETSGGPGMCSNPPAALVLGVPPDAEGRFSARGPVVSGPVADPLERSYDDMAGEFTIPPEDLPIAGQQGGEYRWIVPPEEATDEQGAIAEAVWIEDDGSLWIANAGGLDEAELSRALEALRIDPPSQEIRVEGELPTGLGVLYEREQPWAWSAEERWWMADLVQPGQVGATQGGQRFTLEVSEGATTPWSGAIGPWRLVQVQGHEALLADFNNGSPQVSWSEGGWTIMLTGPVGSDAQLLVLAETVRLDRPGGAGDGATSAG